MAAALSFLWSLDWSTIMLSSVLCVTLIAWLYTKPEKALPGPWGLPYIGSMLALSKFEN